MHNAAIAALGLDAVYIAVHVDSLALPHVIRAFEATGIAGNVTLPHKIAVAQLLIRLTPLAKELASVNTFWPDNGRLAGGQTRGAGVLEGRDHGAAFSPWSGSGKD